jgi:hypothetical protein
MHIRKLIPLAALLIAAVASVSYAAIPSSSGTISACKDNKGVLKVIDAEAGQTCAGNAQPLTWNQQGAAGPAGPQGAPGTARAYAFVEPYSHTVIGVSRAVGIVRANVALALNGSGVCFGGLGFAPENVTATLRFWNTAPAVVSASLDGYQLCPAGFDQAYVAAQLAATGGHTLRPFYVTFN